VQLRSPAPIRPQSETTAKEIDMQASLIQVKEFFSTPTKPVSMSELKELTTEDKQELRELVGEALGL